VRVDDNSLLWWELQELARSSHALMWCHDDGEANVGIGRKLEADLAMFEDFVMNLETSRVFRRWSYKLNEN
jgi:hypothetical protein